MIKFEGEVNGVKFDSVEDYNEALKEAIKSGSQINASSHTYEVEVPDGALKRANDTTNADTTDTLNIGIVEQALSMIPSCNLDLINTDPEHNQHFIDDITKATTSEKFEQLMSLVNQMTDEQREVFKEELFTTHNKFRDNRKASKTAIHDLTESKKDDINSLNVFREKVINLEKRMVDTDKRLAILGCADLALGTICGYIDRIRDAIYGPNTNPVISTQETPETIYDLSRGMNRLLNTIFGIV